MTECAKERKYSSLSTCFASESCEFEDNDFVWTSTDERHVVVFDVIIIVIIVDDVVVKTTTTKTTTWGSW